MNLLEAKEGEEYIVKEIQTDDEELTAFLFSLGCYSGEPITHCLTDFWERLYSETSRRSRAKDRKNAQRSAAKSSIMICSLLDRQVKIINRLGGSIFSL